MEKCPYCYTDVDDRATKCPSCRKEIGKTDSSGIARKKISGCGFTLLVILGISVLGILISVIISSFRSSKPSISTSQTRNNAAITSKPLCKLSDFDLIARWYGGNQSTGEVYQQYVNMIITAKIKNYDTLLSIAQWYRYDNQAIKHLIIAFYYPSSKVPQSKEQFQNNTSNVENAFAYYEWNANPFQENLKLFIDAIPEPKRETATKNKPVLRVETLEDFEKSNFYTNYALIPSDSRRLKDGGINHTYKVGDKGISLELQTNNDKVIGLGVIFSNRDQIFPHELPILFELLRSMEPNIQVDPNIRAYITDNLEQPISQIHRATPISFGNFNMYVGKVSNEQEMILERK